MNRVIGICVIVLVCVVGCSERKDAGKSTKAEMAQTEAQHQGLVKAIPPPRLATSQERKNLVARLERFNTDSKVSYIYLVSFGKVMAFYPMKGKVSSVNSLLTTPDQIVPYRVRGDYTSHVIASPDLDGSYGSNGDAIFFFTTDGTYVEWNGEYMLCDKPLKLSTPPALVIQIEDD